MRVLKFLAIAAAAATLAGCLGGGSGTAAAPELRGTAAIGAPLAGATVTLQGANGTPPLVVTAGPDGRFVFPDTSTVTAPAMLRAEGNAGGRSHTLFSVAVTLPAAGGSAVANVTPLTHELLTLALDAEPTLQEPPTAAQLDKLNLALDRLEEALVAVFAALGLPANTNPLTTPFAADGRGLDQLLDLISFEADVNADNIAISDKSTGTTDSLALTGTVPRVVAPSAAGLDTSGIATLIANFNAWSRPSPDANSDFQTRLRTLFADDYLDYGLNFADSQAEMLADRVNGVPITQTFRNVAIDGCSRRDPQVTNSPFVCNLVLTALSNGVEYGAHRIRVVLDGSNWKILGNQLSFDAEISAVVNSINGNVTAGFNLNVPTDQPGNRTAVSASVQFLNHTTPLGAPFELISYPQSGATQGCTYLAVVGSQCSNFFSLTDEQVNQLNNAVESGGLIARITVTMAGSPQTTTPHDLPIRQRFFTQAAGQAAFAATGISIQRVGTNTINFTGRNLDFLRVVMSRDSDRFITSRPFGERHQILALNGSFTSPSGTTITSVQMVAEDALGRSIWHNQSFTPNP